MAILMLILALVVSIALIFMLALKFGKPKKVPTDILDLDAIPRQAKEKEAIAREDPEDLIV